MSPLYTVFKVNDINGDTGARADRFAIKDALFFEMPIPIPNIDEQEKIGAYFSTIDRLITLHQRKCDQLKQIKKYMLQNMFPQKG